MFPLMWSNTCSSHPLDNYKPETDGVKGVIRAARRKIFQELHIGRNEIIPEKEFTLVTRMIYKSVYDDVWGEHELDYVLFMQEKAFIKVQLDPGEVEDVTLVSPEQLKDLVENPENTITPWFRLIYDRYLFKWWGDYLDGRLRSDYNTIINLNHEDNII